MPGNGGSNERWFWFGMETVLVWIIEDASKMDEVEGLGCVLQYWLALSTLVQSQLILVISINKAHLKRRRK